MTITSGLLIYRYIDRSIEFFLVHPGGPLWRGKDIGVWSIPKGVPDHGEDFKSAAIREFREETGYKGTLPKESDLIDLGKVPYGSKLMCCYAFELDIGNINITSNLFDLEWPPKSGIMHSYPETDDGKYFNLHTAKIKLNPKQVIFIDKLQAHLAV